VAVLGRRLTRAVCRVSLCVFRTLKSGMFLTSFLGEAVQVNGKGIHMRDGNPPGLCSHRPAALAMHRMFLFDRQISVTWELCVPFLVALQVDERGAEGDQGMPSRWQVE
jgi:hypothetical protein